MSHEFYEWWQGDYDDTDNPYQADSPAYWAYAGWQAREAEMIRLRKLADYRLKLLTKMPDGKSWVGLTDEDIYATAKEIGHSYFSVSRAIEAKLKEKNTINTYAPEDSMHINTLGGA